MSLSRKVSVIGSFPYNPKESPTHFTKRCLLTQKGAGVDFPAAQGARGDMVAQFLEDPNLYGFQVEEGGSRFVMVDIPQVNGPVQVEDFETVERLCQEMGYETRGYSIPVTGPFTLASRVVGFGGIPIFDDDSRDELIETIGSVVAKIVAEYDKLFSGSIIRIDEPVADSGGLDRFQHPYIAGIWDGILSQVQNNIPGIHICGSIKQIAPVLMMLTTPQNREVLFSHDFTGQYGENIGQLIPSWVNDTGAVIGAGLVNSGSHIVEIPGNPLLADYVDYEGQTEVPQDARTLYDQLCSTYGRDNIHLHPGCGFGSIMRNLGLDPKNLIHQHIVMNYIIGPKLMVLKELTYD